MTEKTVTITLTAAELAQIKEPSEFFYGSFDALSTDEKAAVDAARHASEKLEAARKEVE